MATFESIFASNNNAKTNLDALFKNSKTRVNPNTKSIMDAIVRTEESVVDNSTTITEPTNIMKPTSSRALARKNKKLKKFPLETESRTIFIGNLPRDTEKEVIIKDLKKHLNKT